MRKSTDEKIMEAIRKREPLEEPYLNVSKILEAGGSGMYLSLCSDRIAESELIDGEDVCINFVDFPDLLVTAEGVRVCREILECYVSKGIVLDAYKALCNEAELRESINAYAKMLRDIKLVGLFRMYIKSAKGDRRYVAAELCQRFILAGCIRRVRGLYYDIFVRIKYRGLLSICSKAAAGVKE